MARPAIQSVRLSDNLVLSECHPDSECRTNNWWLHDERCGMNIGMRELTRDDALVSAIDYWANRAIESEKAHAELVAKVNSFLVQFSEDDDDL